MSDIFSERRLIDYFIMFDLNLSGFIPFNTNSEGVTENNNNKQEENFPLSVSYVHHTIKRYPKDNYKDKHLYELNMESIYEMLPREKVYLNKPPNKFFVLMFTDALGVHYYGFFLKIFHELDRNHPIYLELNDSANSEIKIYTPKYLSFFSTNPYFISFKNLLEEIYLQSTLNNEKCYKIENLLNFLIYRMYLPKNETSQLSWTLNETVYSFTKNVFKCEISYKLLFTYIPRDVIVFLYFAFLVTSKIVFFHSEIEILSPILYLFTQLLYPFTENYCIINNLSTNLIELLECPSINIVVGIYKKDFQDIESLISSMKTSNSSLVYYDMDDKKLVVENHEEIKNKDFLPINRIRDLSDRLEKFEEICKREAEFNKNIKFWDNFQSENVFGSNDVAKTKMKSKKRADSFMPFSSSRSDLRRTTPSDVRENFSDDSVKAAFLDFNLGLIEAYDEKKHYKIDEATEDLIFLTNEFIADSKPDIRKFLEYLTKQPLFDIFLQNLIHMADVKHKDELKANNPKYANYNFKMNQFVMEAAILPNFESNYEFILKGIQRRQENISLQKLSKLRIYNTITVSSPKFEKLPYRQNNIFNDPIHEELMIHDKAIKLNNLKIDFTNLNQYLRDGKKFNPLVFKDENIYIYNKYKQSLRLNNDHEKSTKKLNKNEIANALNERNTNLQEKNNDENFGINGLNGMKFPLSLEIKGLILKNRDLFRSFFGYYSNEVKNFIADIESKFTNKNKNNNDYLYFYNSNNVTNNTNILTNQVQGYTSTNTMNVMNASNNLNSPTNAIRTNSNTNQPNNPPNNLQSAQFMTNISLNPASLIKNFKKSFLTSVSYLNNNDFSPSTNDNNTQNVNHINLRSKEEYIKYFNNFFDTHIKNNTRPVVEFKYNFGLNILQTTSFCEYCMKPNNLWEVRKDISYSKTKKETTTKCKFCGQYFIPYFFVIEESKTRKDNKPKFFKRLKKASDAHSENQNQNQSFQSDFGRIENQSEIQLQSARISKNSDESTNKIVKRVEYMSFEHLIQAFYDYEIEEKNLKTLEGGVKKFPPSLFYNLCILAGEVRMKIDWKEFITAYTLDKYFHSRDVTKSNRNTVGAKNKNDPIQRDNQVNSSNLINSKNSVIFNGVASDINVINNVNIYEDSGNFDNNDKPKNKFLNLFNDFYKNNKNVNEENKTGVTKNNGKRDLKNGKYKKPSSKYDKKYEKTLNIRFDLKDLMAEEKYRIFQSEIHRLTSPPITNDNNNLNSSLTQNTQIYKNLNDYKSVTSKFVLNEEGLVNESPNKIGSKISNQNAERRSITNKSSKTEDNLKIDKIDKNNNKINQEGELHNSLKDSQGITSNNNILKSSVKFHHRSNRGKHAKSKSRGDSTLKVSIEFIEKKTISKSKSKSRSKSVHRERKISEYASSTISAKKNSGINIKNTNNNVDYFHTETNKLNNTDNFIEGSGSHSNNPKIIDIKMLSSFVDSRGFKSDNRINTSDNKTDDKKNQMRMSLNFNSNNTKSKYKETENDENKFRLDTRDSKTENSYVNNFMKKIK